jgi:tRNA pseudouridine55 synthase
MHGIILLNKPLYHSSFQAVQYVKDITGASKVGHGGTLDPLATGMLPICLGEASKFARFILEADKCYIVKADIGTITATGDIEGDIVSSNHSYDLTQPDLLKHMQQFCGEILQTPPSYSALKHEGKPLYEYARKGINIIKPPRLVHIKEFELISWRKPILECKVICSKGTYIRSLLADLGSALGLGASLTTLHRKWVYPFMDSIMLTLEELSHVNNCGDILSAPSYYTLDKIFASMPRLDLSEKTAFDLCCGKKNTIDFDCSNDTIKNNVALFYNNKFLGVATKINIQELSIVKLRSSVVKKLTKC